MLLPCAYYLHLNFWSSFKQQTGPFMTWLLPAPNWLKWESTGECTCEKVFWARPTHHLCTPSIWPHLPARETGNGNPTVCPGKRRKWMLVVTASWLYLMCILCCSLSLWECPSASLLALPWLYGFCMPFQRHLSMPSFRSSFLTRVWVIYSLNASVVPKNLL